jgi:hypothetical protein
MKISSAPTSTQDIETLKKRHKDLDRQKAMAEANHKTAQDQLAALKKDALAKYGTNNLEQLAKKLAEMKDENERKRGEYQKHLNTIETRLSEIEKRDDTDE